MWNVITERCKALVKPKSKNKDIGRREFILKVLLVSTITLSLILVIVSTIAKIYRITKGQPYDGIPTEVMLLVFFIFLMDYLVAQYGKLQLATWIFIVLYAIVPTYTAYKWGADTPEALLGFALIIVIAGIVMNSKTTFFLTGCIFVTIVLFIQGQLNGFIHVSTYWRTLAPELVDAITYGTTLSIIATVSWLSNKEIEKALKRARNSEAALKKEKDMLEIKVEQRTQELRQAQMEKLIQVYHFAEFGRISSSLIHDLITPLNLVSLSLQRLNKNNQIDNQQQVSQTKTLLNRAIYGTENLEKFIKSARQQLQKQDIKEVFSLNNEIEKTIQVVEHKAKEIHVTISFNAETEVQTYGNEVKFSQILLNFLSNAIDSYEKKAINKEVKISLYKKGSSAQIVIQDWGCGIKKEYLDKIFEPFFTTKGNEKGTGLGLSICKSIIEKEFQGTIHVESEERIGTTFLIQIPIKQAPLN